MRVFVVSFGRQQILFVYFFPSLMFWMGRIFEINILLVLVGLTFLFLLC